MEPVFEFKLNDGRDIVSATVTYKEKDVVKEKEFVFFKNSGDFLSQILEYCILKNIPINIKQ